MSTDRTFVVCPNCNLPFWVDMERKDAVQCRCAHCYTLLIVEIDEEWDDDAEEFLETVTASLTSSYETILFDNIAEVGRVP